MKEYICHDCQGTFQAQTKEELLSVLYDHYMKDHISIITEASEEEKKAWMKQFEEDWSIAKEL